MSDNKQSVSKNYCVSKKDGYRRADFDPADTGEVENREEAEAAMAKNLEEIDELQQKLYAEKKEGVIFLFQAMDAAGKDGTIRAVLRCLSPHGTTEYAFKVPTSIEKAHGYLWRIAKCAPEKGCIAIFNRSQYEDVLVGKVHKLYKSEARADRIDPDKVIERRYKDICNFEEYLYHNSVRTVKIFLDVSKEEQGRRFMSRLNEPEKNWKFSAGDLAERAYWDEYQDAFEQAINATATKECPWFIVPADHKWYMRYVVSCIIRDTLRDMNPQWPKMDDEEQAKMAEYRAQLVQEGVEE